MSCCTGRSRAAQLPALQRAGTSWQRQRCERGRGAQEVAALARRGCFDYLVIESTGQQSAQAAVRHLFCLQVELLVLLTLAAWDVVGKPQRCLGCTGTGISEPMPVAAAFFSADGAGSSLSDISSIDAMASRPWRAACDAGVPDTCDSVFSAALQSLCLIDTGTLLRTLPARHRACRRQWGWLVAASAGGAQVTVVDATSFADMALGDERLADRALGAGAGDARSVAGLLADQARPPGALWLPGSRAAAWRLCKATSPRQAVVCSWAPKETRRSSMLCVAACLHPRSSARPTCCVTAAPGGVRGCAGAEQGVHCRAARARARDGGDARTQPGSAHAVR